MTRLIIISSLLVFFFLSTIRCKKEDDAKDKPSITTAQVNNTTATTAACGGSITTDGGAPVSARGVCWSTSQDPTVVDNKTNDGTGTGSYTSNIIDLTPNSTYYVRAYATNSVGTTYGTVQTFKTLDGIAVLTTKTISNITQTTASGGGNITIDGGAPVTARGLVWSTDQTPTVDNNTGKTTDDKGIGIFTSILPNLTPNTTYYVRAYATNSVGTIYGNELFFKTLPTDGTASSIVYNDYTYKTVYINGREWLAENLRTTIYNDGLPIPYVTDNGAWGLPTPAYCWYNNDHETYGNTYGALYNWYAVKTGNLCPTGWHVPTNAEWTQLTTYLGNTSNAGGKLKETGTTHWISPNIGATNETGFTALPGGYRQGNGTFFYNGYYGYWWGSTEIDTYYSWGWEMENTSHLVGKTYQPKALGFSVRCVRD